MCTSPLYRVPFTSPNFGLLTANDQSRLRNHGVFLPYEALQAYESVPRWRSDDVQIVGCGQCTACRLKYSRDWAIRCSLEASLHEYNYFVTLTYDDNSVPTGEFIDYNGDIYDTQLCRRDIQLFIKSYREWERKTNNNTGVKVFYCGEYGDQTSRPHYHLCIFGASEIPDLTFYKKRGEYKYYKSVKYESFWSDNGVLRGFVDISDVSFDSIAYTARYVMKKQQGLLKKDFIDYYDSLDPALRPELRKPCFIGMSLRPGIASEFYRDNKLQIQLEDAVKYQKKFELFSSKPPRYFDKLFDAEDPDGFAKVKAQRKRSGIAARRLQKKLVSEPELDRLLREDQILQDKEKKFHVRSM